MNPDLTYVPKRIHQFIIPSVRRVYFDTTPYTELKKKYEKAEARTKSLKKENDVLVRECERHMAASHAHAEGEKTLGSELDAAKEQINDLQQEVYFTNLSLSDAVERARRAEEDANDARVAYDQLCMDYGDLQRRCEVLERRCRDFGMRLAKLHISHPQNWRTHDVNSSESDEAGPLVKREASGDNSLALVNTRSTRDAHRVKRPLPRSRAMQLKGSHSPPVANRSSTSQRRPRAQDDYDSPPVSRHIKRSRILEPSSDQ